MEKGLEEEKGQLKKTILIAEDDETSFFFLKFLLTKEHVNILYAQSGQEAVDLCDSHPEIDLILMDIKMAGMSGIEATQKIKAKYPDLIVIAQTAFAFTSDKENILKAGCDDYITKPIRKEELLEQLNYYLYSK